VDPNNISREALSSTSWLDFFLAILLKQSETAVELLSKENIEKE